MSKHDKFSPKAIANRQKSVGLQKLRWYCQMCQKQCRDENGFKCHTMSEGHLRQMRLFAENPHSVLDEFSREFERGYVDALSRGHGTKRVLANRVYQEYIADKNHIHMNATVWTTLTGFVKYLGKEGKAVVDETEKGWFIEYIDRDPKLLARQMRADERKQADQDEEDRVRREIDAQVRAVQERQASGAAQAEPEDHALQAGSCGLSLSLSNQPRKRARIAAKPSAFGDGGDDDDAEDQAALGKKKPSSLALMMQESLARPVSVPLPTAAPAVASSTAENPSQPLKVTSNLVQQESAPRSWLREGIWVKVVGGEHKGDKAVVQVLFDETSAELRLDSGETAVLAQKNLQTVVPRVGELAVLLRGEHAGKEAEALEIHKDHFCCDLRLVATGTIVRGVDYDDVSKSCEW